MPVAHVPLSDWRVNSPTNVTGVRNGIAAPGLGLMWGDGICLRGTPR